jgi:hypothetical protein
VLFEAPWLDLRVFNLRNTADSVEQTSKMETTARHERGCATCIAKDTCAKCLFPDPFSVAEYCRIQRSRPALASLFDGLMMVRSLFDNGLIEPDHGPFGLTFLQALGEGELKGDGIVIPLRHCVLLSDSAEKVAFIYSQKHEFLASVAPEHSDVLRVLVASSVSSGSNASAPIPRVLSIDLGAASVALA